MQKQIVEWIKDNEADVKMAGIVLAVINVMIIGAAILSGEYLWIITRIPKFIIANIFFAVPMVYIVRFVRDELL